MMGGGRGDRVVGGSLQVFGFHAILRQWFLLKLCIFGFCRYISFSSPLLACICRIILVFPFLHVLLL
jgi:hypothetical protein